MAWTKRQIITQAFEEIGLASYVFDLEPEQLQGALRRLDNMMATWNGRGIRIGYPLPSSIAASTLDQEVNVTDIAFEAITTNLAIRIAPGYGKVVAPDTKMIARRGYMTLLARQAKPVEKVIDRLAIPMGAGSKYWRYNEDPFFGEPIVEIDAGPDSVLDLE